MNTKPSDIDSAVSYLWRKFGGGVPFMEALADACAFFAVESVALTAAFYKRHPHIDPDGASLIP